MSLANGLVPDWLLGVLTVVLAAYLYATWHFADFKKRNIPFIKPFPFLGTMSSVLLRKESLAEMVATNYKKLQGHRAGGIFEFRNPLLMLRDPELIKTVCVKEFDHFMNHRQTINKDLDPIFSKNLFALSDKPWKDMRTTLSPVFTSSKMKSMFILISDCGKQAADYLEQHCRQQKGGPDSVMPLELKDFITRFATDVIATSAFGVKCDSLAEPKNDFYMMGKDITNFGGFKSFIFMLYAIMPKLASVLRISFFSKESGIFFTKLIRDTISTREREGIVRPDLIHLMMQARDADESKTKLEEEDITAQAVLFFFAGFETSANLICFASYLLTVHPDIQERVQKEIDSMLQQYGQVSYEGVQSLKYMDMVLSETLRMYPPAPAVDRLCSKSLKVPANDTDDEITFHKGDILWIPIYGLHRDPKYFPEPEKFDPDRFSEENKHDILPFSYIPFGAGPRICLAQRFALLEAKVALSHLLSRFSLHVVDKTPIPMKLSRVGFNTTSADGFWCGVKLRTNN